MDRISINNIIVVEKSSAKCGKCDSELIHLSKLRRCPGCHTPFEACVAGYVLVANKERQECSAATGLPCVGIASVIRGYVSYA